MALGRGKKRDWRVRVEKHHCISTEYEVSAHITSLIDRSQPMAMEMGDKPMRYKVIDYHDSSLFVGCPKIFQIKFKDLTGDVIRVSFFSNGKLLYFPAKVLGFGKYKGDEAVRLEFPGFLQIMDDHNLTDLFIDGKISFDVTLPEAETALEAKLISIGKTGVDFQLPKGPDPRESLSAGDQLTINLPLSQGPTLACTCELVYFLENDDDIYLGARLLGLDAEADKALAAWILMIRRLNKGGADQIIQNVEIPQETREVRKKRDNHPVIYEGDPGILIVSQNEDTVYDLAEVLRTKYGVFKTVGVLNNMVTLARRFKPQLIMVDTALDDALELARKFHDGPKGDVPVLMIGRPVDGAENEAARCGAIDFLAVFPMEADAILPRVDEIFQLFINPSEPEKPDMIALGKDYEAVLHQGQPALLVASEDAELVQTLGDLLKESYGVYQTRGSIAHLEERAKSYDVELVLLHDRLGSQSGFDRCRKFTAEKMPDMPVLMMGEPDRSKHNQAMQCGAVDYLNIDFENPKAMLTKIKEVHELFHHEEPSEPQPAQQPEPAPKPTPPQPEPPAKTPVEPPPAPAPEKDFRPLLIPGSPVVLVVSRDEALIKQVGQALKGHYGVYRSKGLSGSVERLINSFAVKLLLVHESLGQESGLELCQTISNGPLAEVPVVVMGDGMRGKQPTAVQHGAVDYLTITPFEAAATLAKIKHVYDLFFQEIEPAPQPTPPAPKPKPPAPKPPKPIQPITPIVPPPQRNRSADEADYDNAVLVRREPYIMIASRNPQLVRQLAGSLQSKYGILITKGAPDKIETLISLYEPKLILLDEHLGEFTGFQVCMEITSGHHQDTPVVIMGKQADAKAKQKQALMEGAVEFLMVDPFIEQLIVSHIRDVLAMFQ